MDACVRRIGVPGDRAQRRPPWEIYVKGPGIIFKGPGIIFKGPGIIFKGPGIIFKWPGIIFKRPGIIFKGNPKGDVTEICVGV